MHFSFYIVFTCCGESFWDLSLFLVGSLSHVCVQVTMCLCISSLLIVVTFVFMLCQICLLFSYLIGRANYDQDGNIIGNTKTFLSGP